MELIKQEESEFQRHKRSPNSLSQRLEYMKLDTLKTK